MSTRQGQFALTTMFTSGKTGRSDFQHGCETLEYENYTEAAGIRRTEVASQDISEPDRTQVIRLLENVLTTLI